MFFSTTTLLGLVLFGFIALLVIMRMVHRSMRRRAERPMNVDFSMADLHEMRANGLVSAEEYERLKQSVLVRKPPEQPTRAGGFQVIQNPPPLPPQDHQSRDAR